MESDNVLKYEYENATVYITKPTEEHMRNIRKATEVFMKMIIKEQMQNESRRNNRRVGLSSVNARKGNKKSEE